MSDVCEDGREGGHGGRKRRVNRKGRGRVGEPERKEVGRRSQEGRERGKEGTRVGEEKRERRRREEGKEKEQGRGG